ncbi:DNA/RNA non-specific endonuclease [Aquirhabdus sp.]|uniref:DNA/RNA non-specific endonuclease n=1 Tax=Aquirhabdus sp. TaxID=2824160 RepID=UPI00396C8A0E
MVSALKTSTFKVSYKILISATLLSASLGTYASCLEDYYGGQEPVLVNQKLATRFTDLCFSAFGIGYSGVTKTPLWSAEYLTQAHVQQAATLVRVDSFHEETALPVADRSTLADYKGSGYDRGHNTPNGDMYDTTAQHDSFSLANIVPQVPKNNQGIWATLEKRTRDSVTRNGNAYVITGGAYIGSTLLTIGNGVTIPTHMYKVVYFPNKDAAGVYWSTNDTSGTYSIISLADLESKIGINLMPTLSSTVKQTALNLDGL